MHIKGRKFIWPKFKLYTFGILTRHKLHTHIKHMKESINHVLVWWVVVFCLRNYEIFTKERPLTVFPKIVSPVGSPRSIFWNECVIFVYPDECDTKVGGCKGNESIMCAIKGRMFKMRIPKTVIMRHVDRAIYPTHPIFNTSNKREN